MKIWQCEDFEVNDTFCKNCYSLHEIFKRLPLIPPHGDQKWPTLDTFSSVDQTVKWEKIKHTKCG